jgi:hypothetical protein
MATRDVSVNGSLVNTFSENGTTDPRQSVCVGVASGDSVEVDTTSTEPFVFDGALVVPPDA